MTEDIQLLDDGSDFGPRCVECGKHDSALVGGRAIYPHRPDLYEKDFWLCSCGAYCGCHRGTQTPLGGPAGHATRRARNATHRVLDPIWQRAKNKRKQRNRVYLFLANRMGITREECHVGLFSQEQCQQAIEILKTWKDKD